MQKRGIFLQPGEVYGFLTIIKEVEGKYYSYLCRCVCGKEKVIMKQSILNGSTVACGCKRGPKVSHGHSGSGKNPTPEYRIWRAMKQRCYNKNNDFYHCYGGRGIKVCSRWRTSFENFLKDMGNRPIGKSLDRFPNKNGNYSPKNCRWADQKQQTNNTRKNIIITHNGITMCQSDWNKKIGMGSSFMSIYRKQGKDMNWMLKRAAKIRRDRRAMQ